MIRNILTQFKSISYEDLGSYCDPNDPSGQVYAEMKQAYDRGQKKIDDIWDGIRAMITKGLSVGAISMLTLMGSQYLGKGPPRENVFWILLIFVIGLALILLRKFILIFYAIHERKGAIDAIPDGFGYFPAPIILKIARFLDYVTFTALSLGMLCGLFMLYCLSRN